MVNRPEWPDDVAIGAATRALGGQRWAGQAHIALHAAVEASPVVPVPPCPTCEGEGWGFRRETVERERWSTERIDRVDCPSCNGTGHDRLIPESEIRAWIKGSRLSNVRDAFDGGYTMALGELQEWLDER